MHAFIRVKQLYDYEIPGYVGVRDLACMNQLRETIRDPSIDFGLGELSIEVR